MIPTPTPAWQPPAPDDPAFGRWYEEQEMLDATYRLIPSERYDYFEERRND